MFLGEYKKFSNIFYCIGQLGTFPITFNTSLTQKKKKKKMKQNKTRTLKFGIYLVAFYQMINTTH